MITVYVIAFCALIVAVSAYIIVGMVCELLLESSLAAKESRSEF